MKKMRLSIVGNADIAEMERQAKIWDRVAALVEGDLGDGFTEQDAWDAHVALKVAVLNLGQRIEKREEQAAIDELDQIAAAKATAEDRAE